MADTPTTSSHINTNVFVATGNLGADAEVSEIGDQKRMSFRIGISNPGKANPTAWVYCTDWSEPRINGLAEYMTVGKQVAIVGKLTTWEGERDGVKTYNTGITVQNLELLGSRSDAATGSASNGAAVTAAVGSDDIPF